MGHMKHHGNLATANYGAFKVRAVAHGDRAKNWYRRAPHASRKA